MEMFAVQDFRRLAELTDAWCMSLLMPTHPSGHETKQDPIRFKNLLTQAEERLTTNGHRPPDVRQRLKSLRRLTDDASFWAHQREGLAAFCLPEETLVYGVPFRLPERVVFGQHPYILPLIPVVSEDIRFHVLAVSPKQVRLLEGTRYSAQELELPGWPEDLQQLTAYIEEEPQLQFHTKAAPDVGEGARTAMFHGHAGGDDSSVRKQRLLEYSRLVDERVQKAVGGDRAPLVLACDERLAAIYRDASDHARVVQQPIAGNPDTRKPAELCSDAWELVAPEVAEAREAAVSRYYQAMANRRAVGHLDAVLPAAHEGRIDTLLVAAGTELWGRYDLELQRLDIHDEPAAEDVELLNLATVLACRQGATIYLLPQDRMPEQQQAVAMLRY
jgi:hypothetical protein